MNVNPCLLIYIFSSSDFEDLAGVDALLLKQRKNS